MGIRSSATDPLSREGVYETQKLFSRMRWSANEVTDQDTGTDLLIAVRDSRGFQARLLLGAQVKTGKSWFDSPESNDSGELVGWWFYENDTRHFDDWITHSIPHLIILHDDKTGHTYWEHISKEKCVATERGCKILVPQSNLLSTNSRDQLYEIVLSQRDLSGPEGLIFNASSSYASPERRFRFALLAPRLIAPHPNAGFKRRPDAVEMLALLIRGRQWQIHAFSREHGDALSIERAAESKKWSWNFYSAVSQFWATGKFVHLQNCRARASEPFKRIACEIFEASALIQIHAYGNALHILSPSLARDDANPVDHAWLLVQRARAQERMGCKDKALEDAVNALSHLRCDTKDETVACISSAASSIIFRCSDFDRQDIESAINSGDNISTWWRTQEIAWGLSYLLEDVFRSWSQSVFSFRAGSDLDSNLTSAMTTAALAGNHEAWCHAGCRLAKAKISSNDLRGSAQDTHYFIELLRDTGSRDDMRIALNCLLSHGPIESIRSIIETTAKLPFPDRFSPSALEIYKACGSFPCRELAEDLALTMLDKLSTASKRDNPWDLIEAVGRLVCTPSSAVSEKLLGMIDNMESYPRFLYGELVQCALSQGVTISSEHTQNSLMALFEHDQEAVARSSFLEILALSGHPEAWGRLLSLAENGNLYASDVLFRNRDHHSYAGERLLGALERQLERILTQCDRPTYGGHDVDWVRLYLAAQLDSQGESPEGIVRYLQHPNGDSGVKFAVVSDLFSRRKEIPRTWRSPLRECLDSVSQPDGRGMRSQGSSRGGVAILEAALGVSDASRKLGACVSLMLGGASDGRAAAVLLRDADLIEHFSLLAGLMRSPSLSVRQSAAYTAGKKAPNALSEANRSVIEFILGAPDVRAHHAFLAGLRGNEGVLSWMVEREEFFEKHPCAELRMSYLEWKATVGATR